MPFDGPTSATSTAAAAQSCGGEADRSEKGGHALSGWFVSVTLLTDGAFAGERTVMKMSLEPGKSSLIRDRASVIA